MQKVTLLGDLSQFGETWHMSCKTVNDVFRLINCQTPTFKQYLISLEEKGLDLEIVRGKHILEREEELFLSLGNEDIIISVVPSGGKSKWVKIIIGVTLMVLSGGMTGPEWLSNAIFSVGLNMTIAGVAEILAPGPEVDALESNEEAIGDKLFNGPVNVSKQGIPVPLLYGELVVGGAAIAAEFSQTEPQTLTAIAAEEVQYVSFDETIPMESGILTGSAYAAQYEDDPGIGGGGGGGVGAPIIGIYGYPSDLKLKENVVVVDSALEKVSKLNGVTFDWKDSGKPSAGVIAQNVEEVMPELVSDTATHKVVDYNGLSSLFIEAIKELKDQNELLKAEIEELKINS